MSCTRRKESPVAIVIGSRGFEIKAGRFALVFPGNRPRVEAAPDLEPGELVFEQRHPGLAPAYGSGRLLLQPVENVFRCNGPVSIEYRLLPENASPAEVYG